MLSTRQELSQYAPSTQRLSVLRNRYIAFNFTSFITEVGLVWFQAVTLFPMIYFEELCTLLYNETHITVTAPQSHKVTSGKCY